MVDQQQGHGGVVQAHQGNAAQAGTGTAGPGQQGGGAQAGAATIAQLPVSLWTGYVYVLLIFMHSL